MLNEDNARTISILCNNVATIQQVPGSKKVVDNLMHHLELLTDQGTAHLVPGTYPINDSGWTLNVCDGHFSLVDEQNVTRLKAEAPKEAVETFEEHVAGLDSRACYALLSELLNTPAEDKADRLAKIKTISEKLNIQLYVF